MFASLLTLGCVPSFEHFRRVQPGEDAGSFDAGAGRDAGAIERRDARADHDGGASCESSVLACAQSCDEALDAVLAQATFDADTGDFSFRPVAGGSGIEAGHLQFSAPETWLISSNQWGFGTSVACAEVEVSFGDVDATAGFLFGLRGPEHGTLMRLRPATGVVQLTVFEPDLVTIDSAPMAIPSGGASARFVLLSFVTEGVAHAEALRLDTSELAVLHGPYGGAADPLELELSFFATSGTARVDWAKVGRPNAAALAILEGP